MIPFDGGELEVCFSGNSRRSERTVTAFRARLEVNLSEKLQLTIAALAHWTIWSFFELSKRCYDVDRTFACLPSLSCVKVNMQSSSLIKWQRHRFELRFLFSNSFPSHSFHPLINLQLLSSAKHSRMLFCGRELISVSISLFNTVVLLSDEDVSNWSALSLSLELIEYCSFEHERTHLFFCCLDEKRSRFNGGNEARTSASSQALSSTVSWSSLLISIAVRGGWTANWNVCSSEHDQRRE